MIFRSNIHQTYNSQFQIGTQKLDLQKQYKYLEKTFNRISYTSLSSKGKGMSG